MKLYDNICSVALSNYGLITSAQAIALGVRLKDLLEWVQNGRLEKCWRGVYRLVNYLPTEYDLYAEALAILGKDAMIWGESVLAMHNLALVNPQKIEVATTFRVRKCLPVWITLVNLREAPSVDVFNGIRCQSLPDVFHQCREKIMEQRLAEAVREAEQRGLLGFMKAQNLKREFPL